MKYRVESDLLGTVNVPSDVLYGAQTQRALGNFPLGCQRSIGTYQTLTQALLLIKKAAAMVNAQTDNLDGEKAKAIIKAVDQVLNKKSAEHFPIHSLHGGGGTSANMNVNEVLANKGEEILGGKRGQYKLLHPNDHVNLHQSTNDVYPTACQMAIISQWSLLRLSLEKLILNLKKKGEEFKDQRRIARTCLQDAVDISFNDFFQGYVGFLNRALSRIEDSVNRLYTVNLGGTIVGRREDVPDKYFEKIVPMLQVVTADSNYKQAQNLFDAAQNPDEMVAVSAQLNLFAKGLIKIANDFRLLSSGPETGLKEITLPPVQPGSSIMPGKINPVIPEFLIQTCFKVIGNDTSCAAGLDHGELDLNVWESSIVINILESMELLENGLIVFAEKCIKNFTVNEEINLKKAASIIPLLTRLATRDGYSKITAVFKESKGDLEVLRNLLNNNFKI